MHYSPAAYHCYSTYLEVALPGQKEVALEVAWGGVLAPADYNYPFLAWPEAQVLWFAAARLRWQSCAVLRKAPALRHSHRDQESLQPACRQLARGCHQESHQHAGSAQSCLLQHYRAADPLASLLSKASEQHQHPQNTACDPVDATANMLFALRGLPSTHTLDPRCQ